MNKTKWLLRWIVVSLVIFLVLTGVFTSFQIVLWITEVLNKINWVLGVLFPLLFVSFVIGGVTLLSFNLEEMIDAIPDAWIEDL